MLTGARRRALPSRDDAGMTLAELLVGMGLLTGRRHARDHFFVAQSQQTGAHDRRQLLDRGRLEPR